MQTHPPLALGIGVYQFPFPLYYVFGPPAQQIKFRGLLSFAQANCSAIGRKCATSQKKRKRKRDGKEPGTYAPSPSLPSWNPTLISLTSRRQLLLSTRSGVCGWAWEDHFECGTNCRCNPDCTANQYESTSRTTWRKNVCTALTNCELGKYVSTTHTLTSNRVCQNCQPNT
jgi:hypothetical protein